MSAPAPDVVEIRRRLDAAADADERVKTARRVTTPGTEVIGVRMGTVFETARAARGISLEQVDALLDSSCYEMRMVAAAVLDFQARAPRLTEQGRQALYDAMMTRLDRFDTWDLIDRAAPRVIGGFLLDRPRDVLFELARSADRWHRRTAVTAAFWIIRQGDLDDPLALCALLADDPEHLVQTNVGVALREIGRVDPARLQGFLAEHEGRLSAVARRTARSAISRPQRS